MVRIQEEARRVQTEFFGFRYIFGFRIIDVMPFFSIFRALKVMNAQPVF